MRMVYLIHPLTTGKLCVENNILILNRIRQHYLDSYVLGCAFIPISSYYVFLNLDGFDTKTDQTRAYITSIKLMMECDHVHAWGDWSNSVGSIKEVERAKAEGKIVKDMSKHKEYIKVYESFLRLEGISCL